MKYKQNWEDTQNRFKAWWDGKSLGRPMMKIVAQRNNPVEALEDVEDYSTDDERYLNIEKRIKKYRNYCKTHEFMAEAYPNLSVDLGTGSMAAYLGCEPIFRKNTVWFKEILSEAQDMEKVIKDPNNKWWLRHIELVKEAKKLAGGDFYIDIPDIFENIDIIQIMRGAQNLCYDLIDEPELLKATVEKLDSYYFYYLDSMYDIVKDESGNSSYTIFEIWAPGKSVKVQCDFSALMSPRQFDEFFLPSLHAQCDKLDYSMYHLDGSDAIKHLDSVLTVKNLRAVQWTAGAGQPDGGGEKWFPIYEKVRAAGKSLWLMLNNGDLYDRIKGMDRVVDTFGKDGMYFYFPDMPEEDAKKLLYHANEKWS